MNESLQDDSELLAQYLKVISAISIAKGRKGVGMSWIKKLNDPLQRSDAIIEILAGAAVEHDDQLYDLCIRAHKIINPDKHT